MRAYPPSPLPVDLLNVVGSFIGDKYHFLTFTLTLSGNLTAQRIVMQARLSRILLNDKPGVFYYAGTMGMFLHVPYGEYNTPLDQWDEIYCEKVTFKNRLDRLKAFRDFTIRGPEHTAYLENEIRRELAKKYAKNIQRMKVLSFL